MGNLKELTGLKFGRLLVLCRDGSDKYGEAMWLCSCECGESKRTLGKSLRNGRTKSCGCLAIESARNNATHGMTTTRAFGAWNSMIQRCTNPNVKSYKDYGARGISVCKEWASSFTSFYSYMGERPEGMSIDRINNDKGYSPDNCRWATNDAQARNKRNTRLNEVAVKAIRFVYEHEGRRILDIARAYNISYSAINHVVHYRTWKEVTV